MSATKLHTHTKQARMENPVQPSLQTATKMQFNWRKIAAFHTNTSEIQNMFMKHLCGKWTQRQSLLGGRLHLVSGFGECLHITGWLLLS